MLTSVLSKTDVNLPMLNLVFVVVNHFLLEIIFTFSLFLSLKKNQAFLFLFSSKVILLHFKSDLKNLTKEMRLSFLTQGLLSQLSGIRKNKISIFTIHK